MRQNNITFLWHVAPRSLVDWHKYFKGTCCLHLQGRRCKMSRREIHVIQGRECRDSNLSSTMAAYFMYAERRGSGFLQTPAQIYHTTEPHSRWGNRFLQTLAPIYHNTQRRIPANLKLNADCHKTSVPTHLVSFHFVVQCSQQTCRT
jgi:hypothetical protein